MITHSGVQMHPGCGRSPEPIDIAVAMCRVTRYAGAVWCPLAAHSILVAEYVRLETKTDLGWAWGLLHDAHETVTGEVTRHYKPSGMKTFEQELDERIFTLFGLDHAKYRDEGLHRAGKPGVGPVKVADEKALCAEALFLELKDWPNYYRAREGQEIPALTDTERAIARAILDSPWRSGGMVSEASPQVETLAAALDFIREGKFHEARRMVSPISVS